MSKLNYAIIGFGGIAENRIAKEGFALDKARFSELEHARLIAATDLNPARQQAAEALGLKWHASIDALLADPQVQAIFVATNNLTHAAIGAQALKAGKPVIVEKPIATTVEDAKMLNNLAKERQLSLCVDHMMVYNAWNIKAKQMLNAGDLGEVNDSCFHMEFAYGYDPDEAASWRCSKVEEMGGPIGDVASHCFYMAEFIFNQKIRRLAAVYLPKLMKIAAEDGAYVKFELENGVQGSAKVAFSEPRGGLGGTLSNLGFELYGSEAVLRTYGSMFQISGHPGEPVQIRMELDRFDGNPDIIKPSKIANIYQSLIENHAVSVLEGKPLNAEDAAHNLHLCELTHKSAEQGGVMLEV